MPEIKMSDERLHELQNTNVKNEKSTIIYRTELELKLNDTVYRPIHITTQTDGTLFRKRVSTDDESIHTLLSDNISISDSFDECQNKKHPSLEWNSVSSDRSSHKLLGRLSTGSSKSQSLYDTNSNLEETSLPKPRPRISKLVENRQLDLFEPRAVSFIDGKEQSADTDSEGSEHGHYIVRKAGSVDTVNVIQRDLSDFIMDKKKEKKRSNSFRKFFAGTFFGNKKKKDEDVPPSKIVNIDRVDNHYKENNSFVRQSPYRHTVNCDNFQNRSNNKHNNNISNGHHINTDQERNYAQNHVSEFNKIRQNFEKATLEEKLGYICMDKTKPEDNTSKDISISSIKKYIDTSASTSTLNSENQNSYENALVVQAELKQVRENEETRKHILERPKPKISDLIMKDNYRQTPPRMQETYQNVSIVKPKARLPPKIDKTTTVEVKINPETIQDRNDHSNHDQNAAPKASFDETYGTVFDSIEYRYRGNRSPSKESPTTPDNSFLRNFSPVPASPSLEGSKLRMPPNREILQPRIKSPIPSSRVSADKIIATELLRPVTPPSYPNVKKPNDSTHQRLEIEIDYPDRIAASTPEHQLKNPKNASLAKQTYRDEAFNDCQDKHFHSDVRSPLLRETSQNSPSSFSNQSMSPSMMHARDSHMPNLRQNSQLSPISKQEDKLIRPENNRCSLTVDNRIQKTQCYDDMYRSKLLYAPNVEKTSGIEQVRAPSSETNPNIHSAPALTVKPTDLRLQHVANIDQNRQNSSTSSPNTSFSFSTAPMVHSPISPKLPTGSRASYSEQSPIPETVELRHKPKQNTKGDTQGIVNLPRSPKKDEIRKSVEAYFWKEIKKIKEQEDNQIYMNQMYLSPGGYAEDPTLNRRDRNRSSRSNRRSSSVPRQIAAYDPPLGTQPLTIPEGSTLILNPYNNGICGYIPPSNFTRNSIDRRTMGTIDNRNGGMYENYGSNRPIIRRGSLSNKPPIQEVQLAANKRVSFSSSTQPSSLQSWPTKNGFTKSPPQRRLEKQTSVLEDEVFEAVTPQKSPDTSHNSKQQRSSRTVNYNSDSDAMYGQVQYRGRPQRTNQNYVDGNMAPVVSQRKLNYNSDSEAVYGQARRYKTLSHREMENLRMAQGRMPNPNMYYQPVPFTMQPRLTRHQSIQLEDSPYGYNMQNVIASRRIPLDAYTYSSDFERNAQRQPVYSTRESAHVGRMNVRPMQEPIYGSRRDSSEPMYVSKPKQVTMSNKVCDMYGQIHDKDVDMGKTGVLMGQLKTSPNQLSYTDDNFKRGTRLTASANNMYYRRNPNENLSPVPARPLPPLPPGGRKTSNKQVPSDSHQSVNNVRQK